MAQTIKIKSPHLITLLVAGMVLSACGNGGSASPVASASHASPRSPLVAASTSAAVPDSGQGAGAVTPSSVADLCAKLDLKVLASEQPGTGPWALASRQQIDDAGMFTGVTGARPPCMFYPRAETFGLDGTDDYVLLSAARTEAERQIFVNSAALPGDAPPVPVGDQGFLTGVDGVVAFRLGVNWFEVWVRLAQPGGDFDHGRSVQFAMQLALGLASNMSGSG